MIVDLFAQRMVGTRDGAVAVELVNIELTIDINGNYVMDATGNYHLTSTVHGPFPCIVFPMAPIGP